MVFCSACFPSPYLSDLHIAANILNILEMLVTIQSGFNLEALVLSAVLSVCAHIKLKVPFSVLDGALYVFPGLWQGRQLLAGPECGTETSRISSM